MHKCPPLIAKLVKWETNKKGPKVIGEMVLKALASLSTELEFHIDTNITKT